MSSKSSGRPPPRGRASGLRALARCARSRRSGRCPRRRERAGLRGRLAPPPGPEFRLPERRRGTRTSPAARPEYRRCGGPRSGRNPIRRDRDRLRPHHRNRPARRSASHAAKDWSTPWRNLLRAAGRRGRVPGARHARSTADRCARYAGRKGSRRSRRASPNRPPERFSPCLARWTTGGGSLTVLSCAVVPQTR